MINSILVPLDGSGISESALPHAGRLARQTGAQLVLVRAAPHAAESAMSTSDLHTAAPHLRVTLRDTERYLDAVQAHLKEQGLAVRVEALDTNAVDAILFATRRYGTDLIVMGTSGRSGMQRALAGSVTQHVLHNTTLPVLLVHAMEGKPANEETQPFRKILVPLDGTILAETAATYLAGEPALLGTATVILLGVASSVGIGPNAADLGQYLTLMGQPFVDSGGFDQQVVHGSAGEAILDAARQGGVDLIVMATHGRIGLDRLLHGSTAYHVVHGASVPVLLLHGSATAAGTEVEQAPDVERA